MARSPTLAELRRCAIARSLFKPVTLPAAIRRLGFVQADPMRAPRVRKTSSSTSG